MGFPDHPRSMPGKPRERGWEMMAGCVGTRSPALKRPGWRRQALGTRGVPRANGQFDTTPTDDPRRAKQAFVG